MNKLIAKSLILLFVFSFLLPIKYAAAAGAALFLSPSSGTYTVGDVFNVNVVLNSGGGDGVNASDAVIKFDTKYLTIKKVAKDSSIFNLWTTEPTFSNSAGTITYSGGSPSAYKGSSGVVMSVTFMVLAAGEGSATFSSASALAADGLGTNILSGNSGGKYTFKEKAPEEPKPPVTPTNKPTSTKETTQPQNTTTGLLPPTPKVESPTHPIENTWYPNNNPEFKWKLLPDVLAVSFSIDQGSSTDPGKKSDGIVESKILSKVTEGKDFFHVKFQNKAGWGPVTHRQILVDTVPPEDFDIAVNNGGDPTNPVPDIVFKTIDVTSGIKNYEIALDGEKKQLTSAEYNKTPYSLPILKPGIHKLSIEVFDQAENSASSSKEFLVEALKAPVITSMPSMINKGDELAIQGTSFYPSATIKIYIAKSEKDIKNVETKTDPDGNWTYFQSNNLDKGDYHVWAKVIDSRGAESNESAKKPLSVQSPSLIALYGLWIIIFLVLVIIFLIFFMLYLRRQHKKQKERAIREAQELEKRLNEIFAALKEEVNELMELADKKAGYSESEKRVRDKINEALDISQEFISKEVKDVEKEIE
jgi:hypothetical protein